MNRWLALCLAASVVLAGCGGTATPSTGTTSAPAADEYDAVAPEPLPGDVNASLVYERVQRLLDVPATADVTVRLGDPADATDDAVSRESFVEYLGVRAHDDGGGPRGVTASGTEITLYPNETWSAALTEVVLAHEFVHALQYQHGVHGRVGDPGAVSMADRAVIEGAATYVQRAYAGRYLDDAPRLVRPFNDSTPYRKLQFAQYSLGGRYYEARIDDPAAVDRVYEDPPTTTEQLLHGYAPGEEPPRELSVEVDAEGYRTDRRTTRGELAVNVVLSTELSDERAWRAAAGWGADELVRFRQLPGPEEEGYAWVLRWDSPAEAGEFREAVAAFLDRRGNRSDGRWTGPDHAYRVDPVAEETVVLLVGTDGFVEAASASGTAGEVTVEISGPSDRVAYRSTIVTPENSKRAPPGRAADSLPPSVLPVTSTSQPWASAISATMASPNPVPSSAVV